MMIAHSSPLDNPVWNALSTVQNHCCIIIDQAKFYLPEFGPFGAIESKQNLPLDLNEYAAINDDFFIVGSQPVLRPNLEIKRRLNCFQFVLENPIDKDYKHNVVELVGEHKQKILPFINHVFPGYFRAKTATLGKYFAIFDKEKIVAVTGERMILSNFTEVSAVATHPDYRRLGYSKALIAATCQAIFEENKVPFLHVYSGNNKAIPLYKSLGFKFRREMNFWNIGRQ